MPFVEMKQPTMEAPAPAATNNSPAYSKPYASGRGFVPEVTPEVTRSTTEPKTEWGTPATAGPAVEEEEAAAGVYPNVINPAGGGVRANAIHNQQWFRFEHGLGMRGFYRGRPELEGVTSNFDWRNLSRPEVSRMPGPMGAPAGWRQAKWAGGKVAGSAQSAWTGAKEGWNEVMGAKPKGTQFEAFPETRQGQLFNPADVTNYQTPATETVPGGFSYANAVTQARAHQQGRLF